MLVGTSIDSFRGAIRVNHLPAGHINDGYSAIPGICGPKLLAIRRNIESFRALANRDHRFIPIACRRALLDEGYRRGADVSRNNTLHIFGNEEHVRPVLTRTHDPVDAFLFGVVARYGLRRFGRKPDFAADKHKAVRTA